MAMNLQFSPLFLDSLEAILEFYDERNGSDTYSKKLLKNFHHQMSLLTVMPDIGRQTDYPNRLAVRTFFVTLSSK